MLQKLSKCLSSDNYGILISKIIHNFNKNNQKVSIFNFSRVISLKKKNKNLKKKFKSILVRSKFRVIKSDNSVFYSLNNNNIILKKRLSVYGRYVFGYTFYNFKKKKFINSFSSIL